MECYLDGKKVSLEEIVRRIYDDIELDKSEQCPPRLYFITK